MTEDEMNRTDHGYNNFVIKAYIITLINNGDSMVATRTLLQSIEKIHNPSNSSGSTIQPFIMPATVPLSIHNDIKNGFSKEYVKTLYDNNGRLKWTWPIHTSQDAIDFSTGLYKKTYNAADWKKVRACTVSHMRLWQHCVDIKEPIMILEHDALFTRPFNYKALALTGHQKNTSSQGKEHSSVGEWTGGICGLNDPIGATRKARVFDAKVKESLHWYKDAGVNGICTAPYVDDLGDLPLPSGLAGNSAYIIKPWAAQKLLDKVSEVGLWPNDALMCRQFFPWLQVYFPYFTALQPMKSTTTT